MQFLKTKLIPVACLVLFVMFLVLSFKLDDVLMNKFCTAMALVSGFYILNKF